MKTVPTVRLADTTDAAVLPDLPKEVRLAMSVAAGMAVMASMFDAEPVSAAA